jgi:hypothetical protein
VDRFRADAVTRPQKTRPLDASSRVGECWSPDYFEDCTGAGAGAGAVLGQQEAASRETAAAAMASLAIFMMLVFCGCCCLTR